METWTNTDGGSGSDSCNCSKIDGRQAQGARWKEQVGLGRRWPAPQRRRGARSGRCFAGGILAAEERPGGFRVQTGLRIHQGCIVEPRLGRIREPRVFLILRPCRGQTHQACLNRSDDAVPCVCQAVLRILAAGGRLPVIWLMLLSTVFPPSYLLIWAGTVEVRRTLLVQD